jgi:hypothetical protein
MMRGSIVFASYYSEKMVADQISCWNFWASKISPFPNMEETKDKNDGHQKKQAKLNIVVSVHLLSSVVVQNQNSFL